MSAPTSITRIATRYASHVTPPALNALKAQERTSVMSVPSVWLSTKGSVFPSVMMDITKKMTTHARSATRTAIPVLGLTEPTVSVAGSGKSSTPSSVSLSVPRTITRITGSVSRAPLGVLVVVAPGLKNVSLADLISSSRSKKASVSPIVD